MEHYQVTTGPQVEDWQVSSNSTVVNSTSDECVNKDHDCIIRERSSDYSELTKLSNGFNWVHMDLGRKVILEDLTSWLNYIVIW